MSCRIGSNIDKAVVERCSPEKISRYYILRLKYYKMFREIITKSALTGHQCRLYPFCIINTVEDLFLFGFNKHFLLFDLAFLFNQLSIGLPSLPVGIYRQYEQQQN